MNQGYTVSLRKEEGGIRKEERPKGFYRGYTAHVERGQKAEGRGQKEGFQGDSDPPAIEDRQNFVWRGSRNPKVGRKKSS